MGSWREVIIGVTTRQLEPQTTSTSVCMYPHVRLLIILCSIKVLLAWFFPLSGLICVPNLQV
jgi:hypothetical protein